MSDAETRIYNALTGSTALAALVSTRIYQGEIPQACEMPVVAFARTGGEPHATLGGDIGSARVIVEVEACSDERLAFGDVNSVALAVRTALKSTASLLSEIKDYDQTRGMRRVVLTYAVIESVSV